MALAISYARLAHKLGRRGKRTAGPAPARLAVERLENRTLLSLTSAVFAVDSSRSSLSLFGTVDGNTISQQGAGSLTTTYSGTVAADWDLDNRTIQFNPTGSAVTAGISGNWQPRTDGALTEEPANYGGIVGISLCDTTIRAAVRNLVASLSSPAPLSLTASGSEHYTFDPTGQTLTINTGRADWHASIHGGFICPDDRHGSQDLGNQSARNEASGPGSLQDQGNGAYALTMPILVTISQDISVSGHNIHIELILVGALAATAHLPFVDLSNGSIGGHYDYATRFEADGGPVHIADPMAQVTYTGSSTLSSMTVTLTNRPDAAQELLAADLSATGLRGSYDSATGVLAITGTAAAQTYTAALRTVTYEDRLPAPSRADRIILVVASDDTNSSLARTSTVSFAVPCHLVLSDVPATLPARMPTDVTVTVLDCRGDPVRSYHRSLHFASTDGSATLPDDYTLTPPGDPGTHTFHNGLTFSRPGTWIASVTDSGSPPLMDSIIVVVPPEAVSTLTIDIQPFFLTDLAGDIKITARDSDGNPATSYRGTVYFTTSDTLATLPDPYTFTPLDAGVHTFFNGVIFRTPGHQTITVADPENRLITPADVYVFPSGNAPSGRAPLVFLDDMSAGFREASALSSIRYSNESGTLAGSAAPSSLTQAAATRSTRRSPSASAPVDQFFAANHRRALGAALPWSQLLAGNDFDRDSTFFCPGSRPIDPCVLPRPFHS